MAAGCVVAAGCLLTPVSEPANKPLGSTRKWPSEQPFGLDAWVSLAVRASQWAG
jgi:hypothetical protein